MGCLSVISYHRNASLISHRPMTQILANIGTLGGSPTFAVVAASNVAQGAAALAVMMIMKKNAK